MGMFLVPIMENMNAAALTTDLDFQGVSKVVIRVRCVLRNMQARAAALRHSRSRWPTACAPPLWPRSRGCIHARLIGIGALDCGRREVQVAPDRQIQLAADGSEFREADIAKLGDPSR